MEYLDNPIGNDGSEADAEYSPSAPVTNHSTQLEHTAGSHDKLSNEGSATSRQDSKNQSVSRCRLPSFNTIRPLFYQQKRTAATTQKATITSETQFSNDFTTSTIIDIEQFYSVIESNEQYLHKSSNLDSRMTGVGEETPQVDNSYLLTHRPHTESESNTENFSHEINQTNNETIASQRLLPSRYISVCGKSTKSDYIKKLHLRSVALRNLELQNQLASSKMNETAVSVTDFVTSKDANAEPMSQTFNYNADANLSHIAIESERRLDTSDILYTKQQTNSLLSCYDLQTNLGGNTHNQDTLDSSNLFLQSTSNSNTWLKGRLVSHVGSHLVENHNKCHVCHKSFSQQSALNEHECMHAVGKPCKCTHCNKTLIPNYTTQVKQHERVQTEVKSYKCQTCGRSLSNKSDFIVHKHEHSGIRPHECKTCGKSFCLKVNLVEHECIHSEEAAEEPYVGKSCGKSFRKNRNLVKHERIHSGEKPYQCKTCGKAFNRRDNLVTHERIHSGGKPYECKTCGKSFTRSNGLKQHEHIHSGEKPYECKACGKSFTQSKSLKQHERNHSGEKPYLCKTCGKSFTQSNGLKQHERIHSGEKPYECKTCGKSFTQSNGLKQHERFHSGEKPYECKACGKSFCLNGDLVKHERIHSAEKPYECKNCGKSFNQCNGLKQHERFHSGEKPYECKTCGKSFTKKQSLKRHIRMHEEQKPCSDPC